MDGDVVQDQAISHEIIDGLEEGLKRLKKFDGRFYCPHSGSSFWFSTSEGKSNGKARKLDDDATFVEYQFSLRRYRLESKALLDMSRSLELEIQRMESEIQPMVLSRGIAKTPDEVLALIMRSLYEPWDPSEKVKPQPEDLRLVNKRFKTVVDSQPFLYSFLTSGMSGTEISRRLDRIGTPVGLKIHLNDKRSNFAKFIDLVIPHTARWEEVQFDYHGYGKVNLQRAYAKLENLTLPRLVRFVLRIRYPAERGEAERIYSKWKTPLLDEVICDDEIPSKLNAIKTIKSIELVDHTGRLWWFDKPGYLNRLSDFLVATTALTSLRVCVSGLHDIKARPESIEGIKLPNLKKLTVNLSFLEFNQTEDDIYRVYGLGNALYRFISQLETPELENLAITVEHEPVWDELTVKFLTNLLQTQAESKNLRRIEFTQSGLPLAICGSSLSNILRNLHLEGTAAFAGIFIQKGSTKGPVKEMSREPPRNLRRLQLKDSSVSADDLRELMRMFSKRDIYPEFEALVLAQCSGFKRDVLRGMAGLEYIRFEDE